MGKKIYNTPSLTVYGDLKQITKASQIGDYTDAPFPAGTPEGKITFCSSGSCP